MNVPRPPVIAAPPTTTAAITFISRPRPALLGIWLKRTALSTAASPVSAPASVNTEQLDARGVEAGEPRGVRVRAGRVDGAAGREVAQRPGERRRAARPRRADATNGIRRLRQPEPLKRRAADPAPTRPASPSAAPRAAPPSSPASRRSTGCRRRRRARRSARRARRPSSARGERRRPAAARRPSPATPATTPQIANTDPTEMSISPVRMTSVMPSATMQHRQVGEEQIAQVLAREVAGRGDREDERRARRWRPRPTFASAASLAVVAPRHCRQSAAAPARGSGPASPRRATGRRRSCPRASRRPDRSCRASPAAPTRS